MATSMDNSSNEPSSGGVSKYTARKAGNDSTAQLANPRQARPPEPIDGYSPSVYSSSSVEQTVSNQQAREDSPSPTPTTAFPGFSAAVGLIWDARRPKPSNNDGKAYVASIDRTAARSAQLAPKVRREVVSARRFLSELGGLGSPSQFESRRSEQG